MDFLRQQLDWVGKHFEKGGKLEALYPLYEAPDTILFTPGIVTKGKTHVRDALDQKRMMITVVVALLPIVLFAMWNTGYQASMAVGQGASAWDGWQTWVYQNALGLSFDATNPFTCGILGALYFLPVLIVTGAVGGHIELAWATVRKHDVTEGFLVTWFLFALIVPPTIPLWQVALGISFGVIIGKEVFGGVGMNVLNPALTARAFLFFAYPAEISGDMVWTAAVADGTVDGWSGATPLSMAASGGTEALTANPDLFMHSFLGLIPGSMGETSAALCLIGALILIVTKIGSYRTMVGVALGTIGMSFLLNVVGSDTNPMFEVPFYWHMVLGGWAFGTVFMATDPVSSAFTDIGKWVYGFMIGVMVVLVRVINPAYPEGMMLAILFMNMFAPLIDHFVVRANVKRREARYGQAA
jgi:Na+-transporting NADH:ubiquinone oxidoreductase subunit B